MRFRRIAWVVGLGAAVGVAILPATTAAASAGFATTANQACAAAGADIQRLPRHQQAKKEISDDVTIVSALVKRLRKIKPPVSEAKEFHAFIAETAEQVTDIRAALTAAEHHEEATADKDLEKVAAAGHASNNTAAKLGLPACAKNYKPEGR